MENEKEKLLDFENEDPFSYTDRADCGALEPNAVQLGFFPCSRYRKPSFKTQVKKGRPSMLGVAPKQYPASRPMTILL
jgi:hypothetical protein